MHNELAAAVASEVHQDRMWSAAQHIAEYCGLNVRISAQTERRKLLLIIQTYVHQLLNSNHMAEAAKILWSPNQFTPEPQSVKDIWNLFDTSDHGLIMGAASMGKCMGPSELCRLHSGGLKKAKDIQRGDKLAGDDGTPRTVLTTIVGKGKLFKVIPSFAPAFVCNEDHVLSLICTWSRKNNRGGKISPRYTPGAFVDVPIKEYLAWSKQKKRAYSLFIRPSVTSETPLQVDPYIYGAWIGDGTRVRAELTSPAGPMVTYWIDYWSALGFDVLERKNITWAVRSKQKGESIWPTKWFQSRNHGEEKRIGNDYLSAGTDQRLNLLAGIIDADGTLSYGNYDITTKWEGLADEIVMLARSLGFFAKKWSRLHRIKSLNFEARYYHIRIMGDVWRIPSKEKPVTLRKKRSVCGNTPVCSFKVEPQPEGEYAGFSLDGNHRFLLGSGIVTHNSYSLGVRLFLEWIRDPEWTGIRVLGPSEDHLEQNLFSHLVALHSQATIPMPGKVGDLFIGTDRRNQMASIRGIVIPKGNVKKAGRLQGGKRKPRLETHPLFGPLSRMFIFCDEFENIPMGIWHDIDNVLSLVSGDGGFKLFGAYNPTNLGDEVAKRAEPPFGWPALDEDVHFRWKSIRGWDVLRLDGEKCENVVQNKIVYPGLQTRAGLELIAQNAGGTDSPGFMTMGRGMYPKQGTKISIIPAGMLAKMIGEFVWMDEPIPVGAADLALDGGDNATYTLGKWGMATGIKYPPSLDFPKGRTVLFKDAKGHVIPRWGLQAETQFPLPPGNTVEMKSAIIDINRRAGVRPEYFACDATGHGRGVADLIKFEWSGAIHDVNYSQAASKEKLMMEDTKTCEEEFERMFSELWFGLRAWGEFGYLLISPKLDMSKMNQQLTQRQFRTGTRKKVEAKKDYKARGFKSPDEADSLTLFVYAARKGSGVIPSMKGDAAVPGNPWEEDWPGPGMIGGARIDESNRSDFLRTDPDEIRDIWDRMQDAQIL